jgi:NADP-dependent 3-hydroxy acid dehydrogenase YdfG
MDGKLNIMDLGIAGKVAFVSGGSMGMGRTTAELFAREGCRVVVAALPEHKESIDDTVGAIQAGGGQAVGVAADLTKEDDVDRSRPPSKPSDRVPTSPWPTSGGRGRAISSP